MSTIRRWYIYLVSAISLQAVAWATIALLRNLFISRLNPPPTSIALQIAIILIGLPIFLAHWLWGQRLAGKAMEERAAVLRRFYLYGMMAGFLGPIIANGFDLIGTFLQVTSTSDRRPYGLSSGDAVVYHTLALLVLGVLWFYHQRIVAGDSTPRTGEAVLETGSAATVRRLYLLGFSATGLTMTTLAIIHVLRWTMLQVGGDVIRDSSLEGLTTEITRLIVGVPLWLIFWRWAQRLFRGPSKEERESALRKLYLYGAVFIGALSAVANGTAILAGIFRRVLDLPAKGDVRTPLPIIIGMGILWAYHAFALRDDADYHRAEKVSEGPRQAGVRRLYLYLIAAIGLAALLVGLSGDVSVIIRSLDPGRGFGTELREQLSWFTAAIIAGLPVWILPWRQAQNQAVEAGPAGTDGRRSVVRKIYVYFFLFVATMTVLSSAVLIVFKVLSWLLGSDTPTRSELGQPIAFSVIAAGVWLYHGFTLRSDHKLSGREQVRDMEDLHVVVVDVDDGRFGRAVVDALRRETPGLDLEPIVLARSGTLADPAGLGEDTGRGRSGAEVATLLTQAGLIVGPWMIAVPGGAGAPGTGGAISPEVSQTLMNSPAHKLLVPTRSTGWEWAGVDRWDTEALVRQTVRAVKQIAAGEEVRPARSLGAGAIIGIIVGVLFLLVLLAIPVLYFFVGGF